MAARPCVRCGDEVDKPVKLPGNPPKRCVSCDKAVARERAKKYHQHHGDPVVHTECVDCGGTIDRPYSGHGKRPMLCLACVIERRRASYREWAKRDVNRAARNDYQRRSREKNGLRWKLKFYGVTEDEYAALSKECGVCSSVDDLCFDHCHDTGRFRGLLCRQCNAAIGQLGDTLAAVERAADYLRRTTG